MIEAKKLAFEDRAQLLRGSRVREGSASRGLLSKDYAAERRELIDPARAHEARPSRQARR